MVTALTPTCLQLLATAGMSTKITRLSGKVRTNDGETTATHLAEAWMTLTGTVGAARLGAAHSSQGARVPYSLIGPGTCSDFELLASGDPRLFRLRWQFR